MLQLSGMLINRPIMSLRTGTQVGTTVAPIMNPNNLKIEGFYCTDTGRKKLVLLYQDIRDVLPQGVVVNDADALTDPEELVRLKDVMNISFELIGKRVYTVDKDKVGKVTDYSTEIETMYVQKLYVSQSLFKSLANGNLGIDRSQIVEITSDRIVINNLEAKMPEAAKAVA